MDRVTLRGDCRLAARLLHAAGLLAAAGPVAAATPPPAAAAALAAGRPAVVIVEYEAAAANAALAAQRAAMPRGLADADWLQAVRDRYAAVKRAADSVRMPPDAEVLQDHSHLPMRTLRLRSPAALAALAAHRSVRAIHEDGVLQRVLAQSLPLVGQPAATAVGYGGAGTSVAVIDDGIDVANPAFGCTAVGQPAGCRIVANQTIVASPGTDFTHGTNVSAIVAGVASQASVAMLNVFSATGASFADIVAAINWAIANRATYNIVAINMSLGDNGHSNTACASGNAFVTPVATARTAGISVVAAAGNLAVANGSFVPGLALPACTPGVVSVGAVYDGNVGGLVWGASPNQCTDASTQADRITCFSQSAPILSLLAPGALITAAGITEGGTSQASPHAAGALAVLRAAFPTETLVQAEARLLTSAVQISDVRNGVTRPRLSLPDALRPANDAFAARQSLAGSSGAVNGTNRLATRESGEPLHAATGQGSVWWTWTAPASGQVTLATAGSSFDTTLAVYTGSTLPGLSSVASNDNARGSNTSALAFQAQAGTAYQWAVDGASSASGDIALAWSLNTAASADLSAAIAGPAQVVAGQPQSYLLTLSSAGPQAATRATLLLALPSGVTLVALPSGCSLVVTQLSCTVASLAAGASASWTVALVFADGIEPAALTATASSDLPDTVSSNNSAGLVVSAARNGDVPMPPWALALLGGALMLRMRAAVR